ncbi:hypothetical protein ALP36_102263 [Pseudomonas syringae pv. coriandricola]|uniref:Uncharacterized protein n=3 Tax=Pseudomonas syringae group genomosp. 3 TaxID=251701 RepID=A0A3M3RRI4_9PSED|nr:hypothetical protein ALQ59_102277 [Pseudomonas syringae pv. apii]RMN98995.1 hypothetical protein ALQ49_101664 [Pseudomonas syringae pv. apii]RMO78392.1 hypothetical protein ALQ36_102929 [Pseudomonas syringae pv. primulae]RMR31053.1 hypothetical protein ALP87_102187 [Pseudomonas syringae pv. coriandricola]RMU09732.1 hypothetical protein ALP36_102263 [Pseudomonas syringae pv. coriandricola]
MSQVQKCKAVIKQRAGPGKGAATGRAASRAGDAQGVSGQRNGDVTRYG